MSDQDSFAWLIEMYQPTDEYDEASTWYLVDDQLIGLSPWTCDPVKARRFKSLQDALDYAPWVQGQPTIRVREHGFASIAGVG